MYKKLRRKIVGYTIVGIFSILAITLLIVNTANFVSSSEQADHITERIASNNGSLNDAPQFNGGPTPEGMNSIHYFTYNLSDEKFVTYNLTNTSQENAVNWAKSLAKKASKGWTNTYYRYRLYTNANKNYVTVIDQSRELTPSYRVLYTSLISGAVGLGVISLLAYFVSKIIVKPIEESDNKQKRFIVDAAQSLKAPVSVISLDNATLIKQNGDNPSNKSIKKQVNKLLDLSNSLNSLVSFNKNDAKFEEINLSNVLKDVINSYSNAFETLSKSLECDIKDNITINADMGMIRKMLFELIDNALKYSDSKAFIKLDKNNQRVSLEIINDSNGIPNGTLDRVFERFYRLDYKDHSKYDGNGLGLNIVKEIITIHEGRVIARGEDNNFIIKVEF